MSEPKNEYQKFADSAVRERLKEEGFGRLRFGLFVGAVGPLSMFLLRAIGQWPPGLWIGRGIMATAPLAIILLIVNFIRMPNESKASPQSLMISFMTLCAAGATIALAKVFELTSIVMP